MFSNIAAVLPPGTLLSSMTERMGKKVMFAIFFLYYICVFFFFLLRGTSRLMEVKSYPSLNKERL